LGELRAGKIHSPPFNRHRDTRLNHVTPLTHDSLVTSWGSEAEEAASQKQKKKKKKKRKRT
jgi:hypothetical protein